jgi:hypothetical protein
MLLMDLVRCRRGLSNLLLMLVSVAMIILLSLCSFEDEIFLNELRSKGFC